MVRFTVLLISLIIFAGEASGGTIRGMIQFNPKAPPPAKHKVKKFKQICGPEVENESLIVNKNRLANVVLTLSGEKFKEGKSREHILDQKKCKYIPHVLVMAKNSELKILASDPTNHNMHTYSFENDPINLMMTPGQDYIHQFEEPEVIKMECDLHKWMSAWIVVAENPYFAISGKKGDFLIPDVPPGKYEIKAWHETLGSIIKTIEVQNDVVQIDFDFTNNSPNVSKNDI